MLNYVFSIFSVVPLRRGGEDTSIKVSIFMKSVVVAFFCYGISVLMLWH